MALVNLAWQKDRFFWDGRVNSLREQAGKPIEDPVEMHLPIAEAEQRRGLGREAHQLRQGALQDHLQRPGDGRRVRQRAVRKIVDPAVVDEA